MAAAVSFAATACREPRPSERVALRLGPGHFAAVRQAPHTAVAAIGEELREVPFTRDRETVARLTNLPPRDGVVRARLRIPGDLADLPTSAFVVSLQELSSPAQKVFAAGLAAGLVWSTVRTGWRLHRHSRDRERAKLVVAVSPRDPAASFNLRLDAFRPVPDVLESEPFDLPAGARIEVGYGLSNAAHAAPGATTDFLATLRCRWRWATVLHCGRIDMRDPQARGWQLATTTIRLGARGCRLRLQLARSTRNAGDPLWSVPRVLAPDSRPEPQGAPNLVLISLDTLRADHVSGYGHFRPTTPAIDRLLIQGGTTLTDVSTTYPLTNFAHLSLFTAFYPAALPAKGTLEAHVPARTLAEALRDAGYATRAITEDVLVGTAYGLGWGFDGITEHHPADAPTRGVRVFHEGARYLRRHRHQRFFLFLHTYKVHSPYAPTAAYRSLFRDAHELPEAVAAVVPQQYRDDFDRYDQSIREADDLVAEFVQKLDRLGLGRRTLVVLLSDHGEGFGEHGLPGHGFTAHQEALRVPLVFRGPGILAGRRVDTPVSLVDVAPTVLELLGLPPLPEVQGRSLGAALQGGSVPVRPIFFEWIGYATCGIRLGMFKLLRNRTSHSIYALSSDPSERRPLAAFSPTMFEAALHDYEIEGARRRQTLETSGASTEEVHVSPETQQALHALGYVR